MYFYKITLSSNYNILDDYCLEYYSKNKVESSVLEHIYIESLEQAVNELFEQTPNKKEMSETNDLYDKTKELSKLIQCKMRDKGFESIKHTSHAIIDQEIESFFVESKLRRLKDAGKRNE